MCTLGVPYGGGVYLLTIAIFASLASSVITSQRALQKKRPTSAECVTRHSRQALRSTRRTSLLYPVEGRNLRDDDQKDFSNRQEGLIIYLKEKKKTENLGDEIVQNNRTRKCKKKGEKNYKEKNDDEINEFELMRLMYLFCRMKGKGCYNLCIGNGRRIAPTPYILSSDSCSTGRREVCVG